MRPDRHGGDRARLERTWLHELSHALDPLFGSVAVVELERWADCLAGMLGQHRPATLAEAAPLLAEVDELVRRRRRRPHVADLTAGLVAWAQLDFAGLAAVLVAHRTVGDPGRALAAASCPCAAARRSPG